MLSQPAFLLEWKQLHSRTPWATGFQASPFVMTWYSHYRDRFEPVVALSRNDSGSLTALMTLAYTQDGSITHAGAQQAEYHSWLTSPGEDAFLSGVIHAFDDLLPWRHLRLKYLPSDAPIDRLLPVSLKSRAEILTHRRPLMSTAVDALKQTLAKKSNKSRYNRLARMGELTLERIEDPARVAEVLGAIVTDYDLRQGAANGASPFRDDPVKRDFVQALIEHPEAPLHVCALRAGNVFLAGHIGMKGHAEVHLSILAHSPLYARNSPGKLMLAMLSETLAAEGYRALDLTPGGDAWKERFATHHDNVSELLVYSTASQLTRRRVEEQMTRAARRILAWAGKTPDDMRRVVQSARRLRPVSLASMLRPRLSDETELRVYRLERSDLSGLAPQNYAMGLNRLQDLLDFAPSEPWHDKGAFLSSAVARLEEGEHLYTYVENDVLLHCGWMVRRQCSGPFSGMDDAFTYPDRSTVLYDFYTHPSACGRGLDQASLSQMLGDLAVDKTVDYVYISVLGNHRSLRHVIETLGFHYQGSRRIKRTPFAPAHGRSEGLMLGAQAVKTEEVA